MMVYPMPGRRVRCPVTSRPVPDEGLTVPDGDLFWARRLRDEDVRTDEQKSAEAAGDDEERAAISDTVVSGDQVVDGKVEEQSPSAPLQLAEEHA